MAHLQCSHWAWKTEVEPIVLVDSRKANSLRGRKRDKQKGNAVLVKRDFTLCLYKRILEGLKKWLYYST